MLPAVDVEDVDDDDACEADSDDTVTRATAAKFDDVCLEKHKAMFCQ